MGIKMLKIIKWLLKLFNIELLIITGKLQTTLTHIETGEQLIQKFGNMVVTAGKSMIAQRLAGDGNDCNITYGAVGTNATAPDVANTTLGTELDRNAVTSIADAANQVLVVTYFGPTEANGTLEEFGLFGEAASAAADSGTMFNHAAISVPKTSSYTLTIDSAITIS